MRGKAHYPLDAKSLTALDAWLQTSTLKGWLYLTIVIDLYSRAVVGRSMKATMATELVLDALMMAVWRRGG